MKSLLVFVAFMMALLVCSDALVTNPQDMLDDMIAGTTMEGSIGIAHDLREKIIANGGCHPNVCFALDGGFAINSTEWRIQKDFVLLVASVVGIDVEAEFAAVQYGRRRTKISDLTNKTDKFLVRIDGEPITHSRVSRTRSGLAFCINHLDREDISVSKIVVFGDARSRFGGNPRRMSLEWQSPVNEICAVGVGFGADIHVLTDLTLDPERVFTVDQWPEVVQVIRDLVWGVCGLPPDF